MRRQATQTKKKAAAAGRSAHRSSDRQVLVRLSSSETDFLSAVVPSKRQRAQYLRRLLARAKALHERKELTNMFAAAAKDLTDQEREERRMLVSGFANRG
jgi:hypothetical protein